jgi:hypothetical protein
MGYGLLTKSLEAKCTFELSEEEILNVERWMFYNEMWIFYNEIKMNHLT